MGFFSKLRSYITGRALIPYVVLMSGLLFTSVVYYNLAATREAENQARFGAEVQEINSAIESRVETYEALLRATAGIYAVNDKVTTAAFRDFVDHLEIRKHYPGLQGIGFAERLTQVQKDALVHSMQSDNDHSFRVWPDGVRDEYYVIIALEPRDDRNELAIGYDIFTDPIRREAMIRARDSGQTLATKAITLKQVIDPAVKQAGFLIYVPVYRPGVNTATVEARREALLGFVYCPLRADDFLGAVLAGKKYDVDFEVKDGSAKDANVLYDSARLTGGPTPGFRPRYAATTTVDVAGQTWTNNFTNRPAFNLGATNTFIPYAMGSGVLISLLFFFVTYSQMRARTAAEKAASELRASEATVRKTLTDRERAEEALRESEERYRELVENANDIVYTLDLNGKMTSVNQAAVMLTGYSREELLEKDLGELMTKGSLETSMHSLNGKLSSQQRTNYEVELLSKSGRVVMVEISSRLMFRNGEPVGVQGIARDITMRRRAEEALREADQRALSAYERLLERISSLSQALGTAHSLLAIFRALKEFALVSVPCDGLFVSLYDARRDLRTACYAWGDGAEIDVTELPEMPVNNVGPNSRAIRSGQVIITNEYMKVNRGHPAVIVGPDNGLRPESSLAAPMAVMGRIVGTIEIQSYQKAAYREEHVTAITMAANLTAVAVENVRLLERESTARAAAEESNRLKDEFLATVSHELRTPLTAILGWSRMLETGDLSEEAAARAIHIIWRNAKSQSQIIDDILDVSRIITGNLSLDLHPIELAPLIESAINVVRPTAEAKGINIEVEMGRNPAVVSGDSNRLQQVIWNLLSNAIKFTDTGGTVRIVLRQVEGQVDIVVTDTGQGISKEFLPFVFDRFRQADSTTTREHGGLGLGLAIARHLVEIHGGSTYASSDGKGTGSTFVVRLPLISSFARSNEEAQSSGNGKKVLNSQHAITGLRVLLVDDDRDTLELLKTALTQCEADVTAVSSANEAIEALNVQRPDVLISDIAMPGRDGYELIKQVRSLTVESTRNLPAVAITAYAKEEDRLKALAAGYQQYVAKPVELSELITAIAAAAKRS